MYRKVRIHNFLFIFPNPGNITAAPAAFAHEYQQTGVDLGGDICDPGHTPAADAPNRVENLELGIAWYGPPDIFGPGCKRIPRLEHTAAVVLFATNKTITDFAVKKVGLHNGSLTIGIRDHFRAARHLHPGLGVASRAEFFLHFLQHLFSIRCTAGCRIKSGMTV